MTNTLNKSKYENVILYLCQKLSGNIRGKKKLAKLLYFADFDFYEKYQKSITGDVYKSYPKGPLPSHLNPILTNMEKGKFIKTSKINEWGNAYAPTEVYEGVKVADISVFDKNEIQMLNRIAKKYGGLNGEQLAELSHAEAPYAGTKAGKEIYYELAHYRGTDFSDL